ncbi:hypothetical protein [Aliivibrio logei]|uniref:hypothetical protein n=1 Tax=Aliivibrio logei TaxID=688 RepID=UPI0035C8B2BB
MSDWYKLEVEEEKAHEKFLTFLNFQYTSERNLFSSWVDGFVIKDGKKKTINQFQTTFHSMFWEVYLNQVFIDSGHKIRGDVTSPDFCIDKNGQTVCVEAVISNISKDNPSEDKRTFEDIYGSNDYYGILDESIIRLYNSFLEKSKKYIDKYSTEAHVKSNPYIIAIGDYAQINYGQSYYYPLLALLYNAYYDEDEKRESLKILCEDSFNKEYKYIDNHIKSNGSLLKMGLFSDVKYQHVSAVIYSCTTTLGKLSSLCEDHFPFPKCVVVERESPNYSYRRLRYSEQQPDETLFDGIFIFHNPYAKNKLPDDFLSEKGVVHFFYDEENNLIKIDFLGKDILKRRFVCMKGTERELLEDFDDFVFYPHQRT